MKPQCNTSADCLRELARVMDQFGIADIFAALRSKYCKWSGGEILNAIAALEAVAKHPDLLTCAIAEVKDKPVFPYQEGLYYKGHPFIPENCPAHFADIEQFSWNPPRPETVMVELWTKDAENEVDEYEHTETTTHRRSRIAQACKKALEELK